VEDGSWRIDRLKDWTQDKAKIGDHHYTDKRRFLGVDFRQRSGRALTAIFFNVVPDRSDRHRPIGILQQLQKNFHSLCRANVILGQRGETLPDSARGRPRS
jgi:hypothetical protein